MKDEQSVKPYVVVRRYTVRVMRSFDYCHFEVTLGDKTKGGDIFTPEYIDEARKEAMRLVDKAVDQYKVAKANAELMTEDLRELHSLEFMADEAGRVPKEERTPEQNAQIKALSDYKFARRRYDYQDDWQEEMRPDRDEDDEA
jgi:hypothetical protein